MRNSRWADYGWVMFFLSGLFFLSDAIQTGDLTVLGSALTWLVGVVFFVVAGRAPSVDA